eukprot:TRINITY_DN8449_c0_g1_i1.p1 TRINITY_DN8449_c0_g1~~TRINITY_DN8449_c0_g1_i1.p1  ORF type:complete len:249 (+),score=55.29 TRINITY_DN8449_c0_g1_i1:75-821(+)
MPVPARRKRWICCSRSDVAGTASPSVASAAAGSPARAATDRCGDAASRSSVEDVPLPAVRSPSPAPSASPSGIPSVPPPPPPTYHEDDLGGRRFRETAWTHTSRSRSGTPQETEHSGSNVTVNNTTHITVYNYQMPNRQDRYRVSPSQKKYQQAADFVEHCHQLGTVESPPARAAQSYAHGHATSTGAGRRAKSNIMAGATWAPQKDDDFCSSSFGLYALKHGQQQPEIQPPGAVFEQVAREQLPTSL